MIFPHNSVLRKPPTKTPLCRRMAELFPHNSVLRKPLAVRVLDAVAFIAFHTILFYGNRDNDVHEYGYENTLSTQFCSTETRCLKRWRCSSVLFELSTQFCSTETSVVGLMIPLHFYTFHTILFYGNLTVRCVSSTVSIAVFPHNSVLRKPMPCSMLLLLLFHFPHNSVLRKQNASYCEQAKYLLSTQFCSTETASSSPSSLWMACPFHTILFYGNSQRSPPQSGGPKPLSTQFCSTETPQVKRVVVLIHVLSTQFCSTETTFTFLDTIFTIILSTQFCSTETRGVE